MALDGNGLVTDNGTNIFLFPKEKDITKNDIDGFVKYYDSDISPEMISKRNYYIGKHPILDKEGDGYSPNNLLVVNYPKYIVDTFNGFFAGIPPKITLEDESDNERLQTFNKAASFFDHFSEASKQASIYGRSYMLVYQNEQTETRIAVFNPETSFIVYDDTVSRNPVAFVTYYYNKDNEIEGTVYKDDGVFDLELNSLSTNIYKQVQAVEFYDNEERQGAFDNVTTLVDSIDNVISQKANDIDYFADSYMKLLGIDLDDVSIEDIRANRVISSPDPENKPDVGFLEKPNADSTQENHLNRLNNWIFQTSMVANITDETFGNASSGKSLEYKLLSMRNLASNKERKFTQQLSKLYQILFSAGTVLDSSKTDEWQQLHFDFSRNLPSNITDEITNFKNASGTLSDKTKLKLVPDLVDDPQAEMDAIEEQTAKRMPNQADYDFQKPDDES